MIDFKTAYSTFRLLFCNPDSDDVLSFMWTYEQVEAGRDIDEISEEVEKNREQHGYAYPEEYKKQMSSNEKRVIAECIATAGYGTSSFDSETGDCQHECYAGIDKIISNKQYWSVYDDCMSTPLNNDFQLGFNFNKYRLKVYSDFSREASRIENE